MPTILEGCSLEVIKEAEDIKSSIGNLIVVFNQPTARQKLEILPNFSIAYFACHGVSKANPAKSHLLLLKQSALPEANYKKEVDMLQVSDICSTEIAGS